jgi:RecJ-like exonuclease
MSEITVHVCGPKKCEHVWDGEAPIMSTCKDCGGTGETNNSKDSTCVFCDGTGLWESGSTRTCSKCNQSAFEVDMWEMP